MAEQRSFFMINSVQEATIGLIGNAEPRRAQQPAVEKYNGSFGMWGP
jgi:hypothetical protein